VKTASETSYTEEDGLRSAETVDPLTSWRWVILSLLFFATTINYLDRAILGVILPEIRDRFHFSLQAYGTIQMMFQVAYGIGSLLSGKLLDRFGTRIGFGVAAAVWSAAAMLSSLARSAVEFGIYRTVLGLGEAANFPASNKAAAEWFPRYERATAMGVVNSAPNFANIIGPPLVIWIALKWGWQTCFTAVGGIGFLWLPLWFLFYRKRRTAGDPISQTSNISIKTVLRYKAAWGYAWAKFLTDPVWWFYLFWLPTYLTDVRHFNAKQRGTALMIIYAISGIGSLGGGLMADFLVRRRGWRVGRARKATMLCCAIVMPVLGLSVLVPDARWAIVLFGLATAAHQAWMTNLFTTPSDVFPARAVGSVNGFGVGIGALGGALFSGLIPGAIIPHTGYVPILLSMNCFYLVAWFVVDRMMGNLEMLKLSGEP
jgi:ACS family hexuronate transporter-like MFS transporter